jgi:transposase
MEPERDVVEPPTTEALMVEPEVVRLIRDLHRRGMGAKRIAHQVGVARNTVRRYLRLGDAAERQEHPGQRVLTDEQREQATALLDGLAEGNAVVVTRLLRQGGATASVRTVQRAVAEHRRQHRAADAATVRFETPPGEQMQIDFGQKLVRIAGELVRVFFFVAVLSHSRRLFVRASLASRQDDWREGIDGAFRHFGGMTRALLIDNDGALRLVGQRHPDGSAVLHPDFAAFCKDRSLDVRICRPYRARTKGKCESGVKFVKRNAVAGLDFVSVAALEAHLAAWMHAADERVHGTTHQRPKERFEAAERAALRPLRSPSLAVRERRLKRRVANDARVDVDTVRYSVPHRLVRETVEVVVLADQVRVLYDGAEVAQHRRSNEPHTEVLDPAHHEGLWRRVQMPDPWTSSESAPPERSPPPVETYHRSLAEYAAVVAGGGR